MLLIAFALVLAPALGAKSPAVPTLIRSHRIIGGEDASISDYPFQGSLRTSSGSHTCGCVLISSTRTVTAAHCVEGSGYSIRYGSASRTSGGQVVDVTTVIQHESWGDGPGSFPNDIAVLYHDEVTVSTASAIPLSDGSSGDYEGDRGFISGWGCTFGFCGSLPVALQHANVNIHTTAFCENEWGSGSINDGHICLGDSQAGIGACNGDSGGPLVESGRSVLLGITSWGSFGCSTGLPSVYTRVSFFRQWVENNI